jgi:voltage-gated potassium channel
MLTLQQRIHEILDGDPLTASPISRTVNAIIISVIILNVVVVVVESYEPFYEAEKELFVLFERFSIAFFTFEFLARIWARGAAYTKENGGARRGRLEYLKSFHGIVDILAIAPFYLQILFPGADLRILRILRMLRLLKISRYNSALEDLVKAIVEERRSFGATLYILSIALTLSSALMYYAENAVQPEKLASILHAMYWSLITLTTVGYGDISPVTPIGKLISSITALLGVSTVAMLTGIVASSFANQIARRRIVFEQELEKAYEDGVLSEQEDALLQELRSRFELSDEEVNSMKKRALKSRRRDSTS